MNETEKTALENDLPPLFAFPNGFGLCIEIKQPDGSWRTMFLTQIIDQGWLEVLQRSTFRFAMYSHVVEFGLNLPATDAPQPGEPEHALGKRTDDAIDTPL